MTYSSDSLVEYANLLSRVDFLANLDKITLTKLAAYFEPVTIKEGDIVFNQGDPGDALYIIVDGQLGVYIYGKAGLANIHIKSLLPGEYLGEMALLTQKQRTATIQAEVDSKLLRLDRIKFIELVNKEPGVALSIAATVSNRLADVLSSNKDSNKNEHEATVAKRKIKPKATIAQPTPSKVTINYSRLFNPLTITIIFSICMYIMGWMTPPPAGMPVAGWKLITSLLAFIVAVNSKILPEGILAILLMAIWAIGGVVKTEIALSGFSSTGWLLVISIIIVALGISSSGLLYRFALWIVAKCHGNYTLTILGFAAAGTLVSPTIPNATSRIIFIAPIVNDLVDALGYSPRSKEAVGIAMTSLVSFGLMVSMFLTSSTTALLVFALLPASSLAKITWVNWLLFGLPMNLTILLGLMGTIFYLYRPAKSNMKADPSKMNSLALQRTILGPISNKEIWALFISLGLVICFITTPLHGIQPTWISIIALSLLALNNLVTADTFKLVNWNLILTFGLLFGLANVFASTGLDHWTSVMIGKLLGDTKSNHLFFLVIVTLICFGVSLLVRWQAASPLITVTLIPVSIAVGVDPLIIGMITIIACNTFFLPFQNTMYLALYHGTNARIFTHEQARPLAYAYAIFTLLGVIVNIPLWHMLGLLK